MRRSAKACVDSSFVWETLIDIDRERKRHFTHERMGKKGQLPEPILQKVIVHSGRMTYGNPLWLTRNIPTYNIHGNYRLFEEFKDIPLTEEAILQFARRYGHIGSNASDRFVYPDGFDLHKNYQPFSGDSLEEWQTEIKAMRAVRILKDAINGLKSDFARSLKALKDQIAWTGDRQGYEPVEDLTTAYAIFLHNDDYQTIFPVSENEGHLIDLIKAGDYKKIAPILLQRMINRYLIQHTSQALFRDKKTTTTLPVSLLGELWWQFSAFAWGTEYKRFGHCENPRCPKGGTMEIERESKRFCSDACRMQYNRLSTKLSG